jgi:MFS transporter, PPP family, 3-phenylpropionic acid transporter
MGETTLNRATDLRLARLYYFVFIGALGFSSPFINLFYLQQGLNGAEIGLVVLVSSLAGLVVAPLWGRLSDGGLSIIRLLQVSLIATAIVLVIRSQLATFVGIAVFASLQGLVGSGIGPLSDTVALRVTEARRAGYGSVRVFGSAGWTVIVPIAGWIISSTSLVVGFVGNAIGYFVSALLLFWMRLPPATPLVGSEPRINGGLAASARTVLGNSALVGLALAVIVRGILNDGQNQFGNIYLQQLGASTGLIGIASMVGAVVELPSMFAADRVVRRIGATRTLLLSFLISGAKFIVVLAFPNVWTLILVRALEGMGLSLFLIGLLRFISDHSPSAQRATLLAFFTVTLAGLISMVGAVVGGVIFDAVGAYWLYALALAGNFCAGALMFAFTRGRDSNKK